MQMQCAAVTATMHQAARCVLSLRTSPVLAMPPAGTELFLSLYITVKIGDVEQTVLFLC